MLENLLKYVASHGFEACHIDDGAVVFGVRLSLNGQDMPFWEWERVTTFREARDAMGY